MISFIYRNRFLVLALAVLFLGLGIFAAFQKQQQPEKNPAQTPPSELDISVCDPGNGPFSTTIDNSYFPLPDNLVQVLESDTDKVQISVLAQTETVAGVETKVVEEREWKDGDLIEVSRNFFAQAPDGTVCYFGEDVDDYENDQIVGHDGAWRAGDGENKPGIIMPAKPFVGQIYQQEIAPGVANDRAEHLAFEDGFTIPAGTFDQVLVVTETPSSTKRYAPGVGLIFDDGMQLVTQ